MACFLNSSIYKEHKQSKLFIMGNLLYIIAVVLIIGWVLGFFVFQVGGGIIHVLLVIAVIAVVVRLIQGRDPI
jgi:flagellar biogenesis protein FliO